MKKIILTGGGTAGHVTPNLAMIPSLRDLGYEIHYIGSYPVSYTHLDVYKRQALAFFNRS